MTKNPVSNLTDYISKFDNALDLELFNLYSEITKENLPNKMLDQKIFDYIWRYRLENKICPICEKNECTILESKNKPQYRKVGYYLHCRTNNVRFSLYPKSISHNKKIRETKILLLLKNEMIEKINDKSVKISQIAKEIGVFFNTAKKWKYRIQELGLNSYGPLSEKNKCEKENYEQMLIFIEFLDFRYRFLKAYPIIPFHDYALTKENTDM